MKVPKLIDDPHEVSLDCFPTSLEKGPGKTVGARSFVGRHVKDCTLYLRLGEGIGKAIQIQA
jgi:hypothetical protein